MDRKAKIVATLGPSSRDETIFTAMVKAGLNVARLNFSHGTYDEHLTAIQMIRKISLETGKSIAILQDLQGPKVRIGEIPGDSIELAAGQQLDVYFADSLDKVHPSPQSKNHWIYIPIPDLLPQLKAGMKILLDDGNIEFKLDRSLD